MSLYRNKTFRIILGIVLCFFFIKTVLYIGRTYWGTMMFLSGTYLFFSIHFLVSLIVELKKLGILMKNIIKKTLTDNHCFL